MRVTKILKLMSIMGSNSCQQKYAAQGRTNLTFINVENSIKLKIRNLRSKG